MVYSWTIHGYEFQESNILNHELLMNSSWIVHGSANRFIPWIVHGLLMNNSWLWISGKQGMSHNAMSWIQTAALLFDYWYTIIFNLIFQVIRWDEGSAVEWCLVTVNLLVSDNISHILTDVERGGGVGGVSPVVSSTCIMIQKHEEKTSFKIAQECIWDEIYIYSTVLFYKLVLV